MASIAAAARSAMTTFDDLPTAIQDRIRMDVALMILVEEEQKAYILRCCALRRQPFIEAGSTPLIFTSEPLRQGSARPTS